MLDEERRDLQTYVAAMAIFSLVLAHMFYTMWMGGAWEMVQRVTSVTFLPDGAAGSKALILAGAGLYFGFLAQFVNDFRKRYQGLILFVGSVVVVGALAWMGIGLPNMGPTPLNVGSFVAGFGVALGVEMLQLREYGLVGDLRYIDLEESTFGHAKDQSGEPLEFSLASTGLVLLVVAFVGAGNVLNFLLVAPDVGILQVVHLVVSVAFLFFLNSFVKLDVGGTTPDDRQFEILGPTQSGKTYSTLGLFLEAGRSDRYSVTDLGGEMATLVENHQEMADVRGEGESTLDWSIDNTLPDETNELSFEIIKNGGFSRKVQFNTVDHAGELLEDISYALVGTETATDGGYEEEIEAEAEERDDESTVRVSQENAEIIFNKEDEVPEETEHVEEGTEAEEATSEARDDDEAETATVTDASSEPEGEQMGRSGFAAAPEEEVAETDSQTASDRVGERPEDEASADSGSAATDAAEGGDDGTAGPRDNSDESVRDKTIQSVVDNIQESDQLVMLLDTERFLGNVPKGSGSQSMEIKNFNRIRKHSDVDDVVLVATKSDLLIDKWQAERGYSGPPSESRQRWEDFSEWVSDDYMSNDMIGAFMSTLGTTTVYPVYFKTEERDGNRYPRPDEKGRIQPVGYEEALDAIVRNS